MNLSVFVSIQYLSFQAVIDYNLFVLPLKSNPSEYRICKIGMRLKKKKRVYFKVHQGRPRKLLADSDSIIKMLFIFTPQSHILHVKSDKH